MGRWYTVREDGVISEGTEKAGLAGGGEWRGAFLHINRPVLFSANERVPARSGCVIGYTGRAPGQQGEERLRLERGPRWVKGACVHSRTVALWSKGGAWWIGEFPSMGGTGGSLYQLQRASLRSGQLL